MNEVAVPAERGMGPQELGAGRLYNRRPRHRQDAWADLLTAAHTWVLTRRDRNPWAWACVFGIAVAFLGPH